MFVSVLQNFVREVLNEKKRTLEDDCITRLLLKKARTETPVLVGRKERGRSIRKRGSKWVRAVIRVMIAL